MKKILNNKLYNTETAREVGYYQYSYPSDFNWSVSFSCMMKTPPTT